MQLSDKQTISLICYGIKDNSLQAQIVQFGHKNINSLMNQLSSIQSKPHVLNRRDEKVSSITATLGGRVHTKSDIRCYNCEKLGHRRINCTQNFIKREGSSTPAPTAGKSFCTFCKRKGHTFDSCFKRKYNGRDKETEPIKRPRINTCVSPLPKFENREINTINNLNYYPLSINNKIYEVLLDTGAQISLVKQSTTKDFKSKLIYEPIMIIGAGGNSFKSKYNIEVSIKINAIIIPFKLHVVSDNTICCNVIIGLDFIINQNTL